MKSFALSILAMLMFLAAALAPVQAATVLTRKNGIYALAAVGGYKLAKPAFNHVVKPVAKGAVKVVKKTL